MYNTTPIPSLGVDHTLLGAHITHADMSWVHLSVNNMTQCHVTVLSQYTCDMYKSCDQLYLQISGVHTVTRAF